MGRSEGCGPEGGSADMVHKVTDGERGQEEGEGSQAGGRPLPPPALARLLVTVDFNGSAMGWGLPKVGLKFA